MRSVAAPAALLTLVVAAAGCGLPTGAGAAPPTLAAPAPAVAAESPEPTHLRIPRLGISTGLTGLGLDPDGSIQEPPVTRPAEVGWYRLGVRPGDPGPAVILGHVSGRPAGAPHAIPGVFAHLDQLRPGDEILVDRETSGPARFVVYAVATVPKDRFPTERVYGDTSGPELRLITCGGRFRTDVRSYDSNVLIFARLVA